MRKLVTAIISFLLLLTLSCNNRSVAKEQEDENKIISVLYDSLAKKISTPPVFFDEVVSFKDSIEAVKTARRIKDSILLNTNYLLLEEAQDEYVLLMDGKKEIDPQKLENIKTFFITSKETYETYLNVKKKKHVQGEPPPLDGLTFKAESTRTITACDLTRFNKIDFTWLWEHKRKVTANYIELNNFQNLHLVLKNNDHYIVYKVHQEFSSH